jgi:hypothetical protein
MVLLRLQKTDYKSNVMEKDGDSWTDRVRNEEVLQRVKEERNILHAIKLRKARFIGHILHRNRQLKHVTEEEGRIVTGRRGKRRKQLLDDLKEARGYWKMKEDAPNRTLCKRMGTCRKTS